jgi:hypothetical protein
MILLNDLKIEHSIQNIFFLLQFNFGSAGVNFLLKNKLDVVTGVGLQISKII